VWLSDAGPTIVGILHTSFLVLVLLGGGLRKGRTLEIYHALVRSVRGQINTRLNDFVELAFRRERSALSPKRLVPDKP